MIRPKQASRFLSSRVARRIFLLFVLCALGPLILFAAISLRNVAGQLERQTAVRLHEACKAVGMTVVERLSYLRDDLSLMVAERIDELSGGLGDAPQTLSQRLDMRFAWVALGDPQGRVLDGTRDGIVLPALDIRQREHIGNQGGIVLFESGAGAQPATILAVGVPGNADQFVFGEARRDHLWAGEGVLSPNTEFIALTEQGDVLYTNHSHAELAMAAHEAFRMNPASGQFEWRAAGNRYLASYRTMFTSPQFFNNFVLAHGRGRNLILGPVVDFKLLFLLFSAFTFLTVCLASLAQIRRSLVPIEELSRATEKVLSRDFSVRVEIETQDEFRDLGASFNEMTASLARHVETMDALHQIGVALTAETHTDRLLQIIGEGTLRVTHADVVLLHLRKAEGQLELAYVGSGGQVCSMDWTTIHDPVRSADERPTLLDRAVTMGKPMAVDDLGRADGLEHTPYRKIEEILGEQVGSVVCVPMRDHEEQVIGALELVNLKEKHTAGIRPSTLEERRAAESLASQAAVALTKNRLVDDFRGLFEALTELIATAIDEKSKYTGDHCRRVPILTMMIAEAACQATEGPFADFSLTGDELYELKVAALLHDCGKVVTPVHVVDKATKLQTLFDRIELVRARFEVAKRDVRIHHLEQALEQSGAIDEVQLHGDIQDAVRALDDDLAFLEHSNIGGEFLSPQDQERIRTIATSRSWQGSDGQTISLLSDEEVINLSISRGTLNAEEREIINHHVVATIKMLESLPYPANLSRVPEIAGAHHERMDGKGYPLGLQRSQINEQARMLGIADVFEALTAKDRPYKDGKTLTETLVILGRMKESGHVDPDLFHLLIKSGVYLRYAEEFLGPEQIDEVDLSSIPGYERGTSEDLRASA